MVSSFNCKYLSGTTPHNFLNGNKSPVCQLRLFFIFISLTTLLVGFLAVAAYSQTNSYYTNQPSTGFSNSKVFRQEIARLEITVSRDGKPALPLTQVPRVAKDDILRIKLSEDAVGGTKLDQSDYDWTLVVAFINPNQNDSDEKSVSQEIRFREKGWYKEHVFKAPYDCQPIIFLYTKPKYRAKISALINKNPEEIRKLGEKTIEIAGAYAQIGMFLNELQEVVNRTRHYPNAGYGGYYSGGYGGYGSYGYGNQGNQNAPDINNSVFAEQTVERLAKSFNIQLPQCWRSGGSYNSYNSYNSNNSYNNNFYGSNYGSYSQDLIGRVQCVAQNVRIEDLDISLSNVIRQGGVLVAAQIAQKYPQIAYWINIAAAAMDIILKITRKSPLKIVPTMIATSEFSSPGYNQNYANQYYSNQNGQNYYAPNSTGANPNNYNNGNSKISVYAENQPGDDRFVTAYPVIVQKWQPEPDPENLRIPAPFPADPCLHPGQNILRSTDLSQDWLNDQFTRNFKLIMSSSNGFYKEFPLRKNAGFLGWDLNLSREDLNAFPKIGMAIDAEVVGTRGFTELRSPKFNLAVSSAAKWEVKTESQKNFTIGGKRQITLFNSLGSCLCLQAVVLKPSFGGQFVFEANTKDLGLRLSENGREASFIIDATEFKAGDATLELITYGGDKSVINTKIYPPLPVIEELRIAKGDREALIKGERLGQLQGIFINGLKAKILPNGNSEEKTVVFENPSAKQLLDTISIELLLDNERRVSYPQNFTTSISRPVLVSHGDKEVVGDYVISKNDSANRSLVASDWTQSSKNLESENSKAAQQTIVFRKGKKAIAVQSLLESSLPGLENLPVIPIEADIVSVSARNALTDHDFKVENLAVEVKIENGITISEDFIKSDFEVLDWKNMRLTFALTDRIKKMLGGRRLQFRIKDKERGSSDWYAIKQTFVRTPQITLINCPNDITRGCELIGEGLDYIAQVSVDGGVTWLAFDKSESQVKMMNDGTKSLSIPRIRNKKLLKIRLKDFPK